MKVIKWVWYIIRLVWALCFRLDIGEPIDEYHG